MDVKFAKRGLMRFISHLDLMRLFSRAVRRAGLPVALTEGYNPHQKISIKRALKLGVISEDEEAAFSLSGEVGAEEFKNRLQRQMPEGIEIKEARIKIQ